MSFVRGERILFDPELGSNANSQNREDGEQSMPAPASTAFVGDIVERSTAAIAPLAPTLKPNSAGFPEHKKRVPRVSAFKQQRAKSNATAPAIKETAPVPPSHVGGSLADEERRIIDKENTQRLAAMSEQEIEQERNELLANLSPALLQKLLGRANVDYGSNERSHLGLAPPPTAASDDIQSETEQKTANSKKVSFAESPSPAPESANQPTQPPTDLTLPPQSQPEPTSEKPPSPTQEESSSIHFPTPTQPPDLDPSDPSFLENLHEKYFPNLPYDPSSLSWMAPIDLTDKSSPYHPSHTAFDPAELRFNFRGELLAPSVARQLPTTHGLHHHADAPEAAGYTIPEFAVMARSAVAAQRCVAYQTLGRILFRLGQGEWGVERAKQETDGPVKVARDPAQAGEGEDDDEDRDSGSELATGLWDCIEQGRVVETLTEEAAKAKGHLTAKTFAQEALWYWRRGGGRKRQAI